MESYELLIERWSPRNKKNNFFDIEYSDEIRLQHYCTCGELHEWKIKAIGEIKKNTADCPVCEKAEGSVCSCQRVEPERPERPAGRPAAGSGFFWAWIRWGRARFRLGGADVSSNPKIGL